MEMEYNNYAPSSYYSVLGVGTNSSDEDIRRAYRKLAMQWHPDRWSRTPLLLGEAKNKFQQIQEAYSVLSDKTKRMMYDAGLYNCFDEEDDEVEGFSEFVQEMMSLVEDARKEEKSYSIEELQSIFWDMAQSFQTTTNNGGSWDMEVNNNPPNQTFYDDNGPFNDGSFAFYDSGNTAGDYTASMFQTTYDPHQFCR